MATKYVMTEDQRRKVLRLLDQLSYSRRVTYSDASLIDDIYTIISRQLEEIKG